MSESHQEKIKRLFSLAFPTRKSFTDIDIQYEGTSGKGENFTSDVYFLKITSKNENNQLGDDKYHLILKQPPTNICEDSPIYHAFQKEIFTYGTVIATFREWEKEKKLNILDLIVPKCFLVGLYDNEMVILLENLKVSGFVLQQQHKGLDFNHLKLTLESYGKWHAFSLAYKDQYPEKFEQLFSNVTPGYLQHLPDVLKNLIELSEKTTYNILYKNKEMELHEKLRELFPNGFYSRWIEILHIKEENSAFLHGDAWKNNFLFKYKDSNKTIPEQVKIIDFQVPSVASPVLDLSYHIYGSGSPKELEQFETLLKVYHKSLQATLKQLGTNNAEIFPYNELIRQWKKYSSWGLIMGLVAIPFVLSEKEDSVDINEPGTEHLEEMFKAVEKKSANETLMRTISVLKHWLEFCKPSISN